MINGKIRAIGSAINLKNKYGLQYMMWVTIDIEKIDTEEIKGISVNDDLKLLLNEVVINDQDTIAKNTFE